MIHEKIHRNLPTTTTTISTKKEDDKKKKTGTTTNEESLSLEHRRLKGRQKLRIYAAVNFKIILCEVWTNLAFHDNKSKIVFYILPFKSTKRVCVISGIKKNLLRSHEKKIQNC